MCKNLRIQDAGKYFFHSTVDKKDYREGENTVFLELDSYLKSLILVQR